jgi:hypothetical protein
MYEAERLLKQWHCGFSWCPSPRAILDIDFRRRTRQCANKASSSREDLKQKLLVIGDKLLSTRLAANAYN